LEGSTRLNSFLKSRVRGNRSLGMISTLG
jgi:hypothetical protein